MAENVQTAHTVGAVVRVSEQMDMVTWVDTFRTMIDSREPWPVYLCGLHTNPENLGKAYYFHDVVSILKGHFTESININVTVIELDITDLFNINYVLDVGDDHDMSNDPPRV